MASEAQIIGRQRLSWSGILFGVGAGALWGLVFIAPELASGFGPLELTIGRYLAYGLVSALLIAPRWKSLAGQIGARDWRALVVLGITGNALYYVLLSAAVQNGGVAMTSLVIGFLPVIVTIAGSRMHGALPLGKLVPSMLLCLAGTACIFWQALSAPLSGSVEQNLFGLLCAIGALFSWGYFAIANSRCLVRLDKVSAHDWSLLTGLVSGGLALALVPLAMLFGSTGHTPAAWLHLAAISAGIAVLSSVIGNALWNAMSRRLPMTLVGQMILFETLFALFYGFLWEQRLPTALETLAFALVAWSVVLSTAMHRRNG